MDLRSVDHDRYLELGRVVTGEVMERVFGEWRRARSTCGGGLVWFLRDLWAGAGWGVVDAAGAPKAAWYSLRRAFRPLAIHVSDEGNNGLALHVCNDRPEPFQGRLELALFRAGEVPVGRGEIAVDVGPHAQIELPAAAAFDGFLDLSYAYRFGPPPYDVLAATLRRSDGPAGDVAASAFHFPAGLPATRELDVGLAAEATLDDAGAHLTVRTRRFAQSVAIDCEGFAPEDAFFHLAPGDARVVRLSRKSNGAVLKGSVKALNSEATARIAVATP